MLADDLRNVLGWDPHPPREEQTQPGLEYRRQGECYICGRSLSIYGLPAMCERCHGLVKRYRPREAR